MTLLTPELLDSKTYGFEKLRYLFQSLHVQEGVIDPGDLKVTQNGTPNMSANVAAGRCFVQADTGTRNGLYHCVNDATVNVAVTASHATLPRLDQLILRINDSTDLGSGSDVPTLEVLPGTPTSGATLDNRNGFATLPNNAILLADILVPATSTTVTTANIRDRRRWARGAQRVIKRNSGDYTTTSTTGAIVDGTNLQPRIECSGMPLRVEVNGEWTNNTSDVSNFMRLGIDTIMQTAERRGSSHFPTANRDKGFDFAFDLMTPGAGSKLLSAQWFVGAGTATLRANATQPLLMTIWETVRSNAENT